MSDIVPLETKKRRRRGPRVADQLNVLPYAASIAASQKISGLGRNKIYELIAQRKIRAIKADSRTLIVVQSMIDYLESCPAFETQNPDNREAS
jgi:hypothetical protein